MGSITEMVQEKKGTVLSSGDGSRDGQSAISWNSQGEREAQMKRTVLDLARRLSQEP